MEEMKHDEEFFELIYVRKDSRFSGNVIEIPKVVETSEEEELPYINEDLHKWASSKGLRVEGSKLIMVKLLIDLKLKQKTFDRICWYPTDYGKFSLIGESCNSYIQKEIKRSTLLFYIIKHCANNEVYNAIIKMMKSIENSEEFLFRVRLLKSKCDSKMTLIRQLKITALTSGAIIANTLLNKYL